MSSLLSSAMREIVHVLAVEVAKHVAKNLTNTDDKEHNTKDSDPAAVASFPPEDLRAECLAIVNKLAPTHGPELREALANAGGKRLREIADEALPALLTSLTELQTNGR